MATVEKLTDQPSPVRPATVSVRSTAEEYLAFDRASELRHEFIDGQIIPMQHGEAVAMSGTSMAHLRIATALLIELDRQLEGRDCEALGMDLRVGVGLSGAYLYPDVVIVRGSPEMSDDAFDTLRNPLVVVEVLSPSTEARDRGRKSQLYRKIPSLRQYVLVSQELPLIEIYTRREAAWELSEVSGLDATLRLDAAGVSVPLARIYRKVSFPADESSPDAASTDPGGHPPASAQPS